jgi:methionine-gamma-lyase
MGGSISSRTEQLHALFFQQLKLFGGVLSPFDGFLLARGIKTLDVRMKRHNENAIKVAQWLENHNMIQRVYYPGLPSHPQHGLAKKQMRGGFGGMVCFEVCGGVQAGATVIENLKLITLAVSLGGVESLIEHAASMTHVMVSREERLSAGITDGLIRLSVGLENADDLIADLSQALDLIK